MNARELSVGDCVIVRSASEIRSTLDKNGTLDGLPFMPEMLSWCGKSFRIQRRIDKTCVDGDPMRYFPKNDVVILDGPRCPGTGHDGCNRGCRIFWKEAWLRRDEGSADIRHADAGLADLRSCLKVKSDEQRYFCQSTQLRKATVEFPRERWPRRLRVALTAIRNGDLGVLHVGGLFSLWLWQKLRRATGSDRLLNGPNVRVPTQSLNLQPGEIVRIKPRSQIVQTLDRKKSNRGLVICYEMTRCCGREAEVRFRVERLINESTGTMREISDTVALSKMHGCRFLGEECLCFAEPGDCPRGELMYWREIWLERVGPPAPGR